MTRNCWGIVCPPPPPQQSQLKSPKGFASKQQPTDTKNTHHAQFHHRHRLSAFVSAETCMICPRDMTQDCRETLTRVCIKPANRHFLRHALRHCRTGAHARIEECAGIYGRFIQPNRAKLISGCIKFALAAAGLVKFVPASRRQPAGRHTFTWQLHAAGFTYSRHGAPYVRKGAAAAAAASVGHSARTGLHIHDDNDNDDDVDDDNGAGDNDDGYVSYI